MRFELHRDPARFARQAGPLLQRRIECNVMATILGSILEGRYSDPPPLFALGFDPEPEERVAWAALRTPPLPMVAAPGLPPESAGELVDRWLAEDPELAGANSVPEVARAIAEALAERTGRAQRLRTSMALHVLEGLCDPPRPAPGGLRQARAHDRPLLVEWWEAFQRDAGIGAGGLVGLDSRLEAGGVHLWEVDGEPVSLVAHSAPVAGVARIGPVYTPAELRRRGYAGTAVAALSRRLLAGGVERCILYTDLANPTSNKIYAEVGYRRIGDWEERQLA